MFLLLLLSKSWAFIEEGEASYSVRNIGNLSFYIDVVITVQ